MQSKEPRRGERAETGNRTEDPRRGKSEEPRRGKRAETGNVDRGPGDRTLVNYRVFFSTNTTSMFEQYGLGGGSAAGISFVDNCLIYRRHITPI